VEQQPPRGLGVTQLGVTQQSNLISDSGYWSPKNYNNSDYNVPTTRPPPDFQHTMSNSVSSRPMVPPPAPPPSTTPSVTNSRMVQSSGHQVVHQPSHVSTASAGRVSASRDSLPPPPPAPSSLPEPQTLQLAGVENEAMPATADDDTVQNMDFELPPPPMPALYDDMPPDPPSPVTLYPQLELPESPPLPLPPEDVNFDMMVVPPPPPPLAESEQISDKLDDAVVSAVDYNFDRLLPDSASMSSEASSQAAKSVNEDTRETPVRDHRSDLLDAIRKGQDAPFNHILTALQLFPVLCCCWLGERKGVHPAAIVHKGLLIGR